MKNRCKILLGDRSLCFGKVYIENLGLDKNLFEIILSENDGIAILKKIEEERPQIVIVDYVMPYMNAISLMEACSKNRPYFIVMHDIDHELVKHTILKAGASRFLLKPFSVEVLRHTILSLAGTNCQNSMPVQDSNIELDIIEQLNILGVPTQLKGYSYIKSALKRGIEKPYAFELITKVLYKELAEEFHTTISGVERAIRFAVEKTWVRGNIDVICQLFAYNPNYNPNAANHQVPSNSEFLSKMVEIIKLQKRNNYKYR